MQHKKTEITDDLYAYAVKYGVHEHPILTEIRDYTANMPNSRMQIPSFQGQIMRLLAKLVNAKKYLEIGVFTGYSSLSMALGMGENSIVYGLDNSHEHLEIAKKFWNKAIISSQFMTMEGPALESLETLISQGRHNYFDIAFIDANKTDYLKYYEYCYKLVRSGGIILIDNVLFQGKVLDPEPKDFIQAIKEFNQFIYNDERVDMTLLPLADGLTIAYKKEC